MIKDRVQRKRYLRKSPKTSIADFDFGRWDNFMPFMSSFIDFGRRRSLNLVGVAHGSERAIGHRDTLGNVQLDLCPSLLFGGVDIGLLFEFCFGTGLDGIAVSIVPDNGGDLGISGLVFLSREPVHSDHVSPRMSAPMVEMKGRKSSLRVKGKCGGEGTRGAYLVTSYIFGISPGSRSA